MKTQLTLTVMGLVLSLSTTAFAGVEDFHSMIVESQQAKKELTQKLHKNVEVVKEEAQEANWNSRQKVVIQDEETGTEYISVPSNPFAPQNRKSSRASANMEKNAMDRLSQEFQDAQ